MTHQDRLNLHTFGQTTRPPCRFTRIHLAVYLAEVDCKKAAADNVEFAFSGAGKFTEEARRAGHVLLSHIIRLHYNYKYDGSCGPGRP